ncbi:putative leucine-rich repeat-containing protein DDB_G0290503 [Rhopilema esculentum]|uniref:putative leucine-rich repeat-containing protein DDB_G0290503 n=1 Tax=Rhopilema esculentum TaxID=499914 RepID=UPI0031D8971C
MRSESRKHLTEMKEIISALEKEGLGPEQCSSEEVVRVLFSRQKDLAEKLKETEDVLSACKNGDPRPIIQELKAEKKTLKRTVDDLRQNVSSLESHLKLTEMTSKRQLEDLLAEKKSSFLQLQKSMDDWDAAKIAAEQAQKDLVDTKSMLNKRQNELQLLRDNLLNVTNEMKTVDADLGKTRKDLSIKTAELERVKRDLVVESERVQQERKNNSRVSSELETKKKVIKESEKFIAELESKVQRLSENLEASQMHINRASSERDSAKEVVLSLQEKLVTNEAELRQANSVVANLKNQIKSLEYTFQEKVDKFASISTELEKAKADCLGASHLLGIEEDRNKELEDEIDDLTYKLTEKTEEVERLLERIKVLEDDLHHATSRFDSIQLEYAETETSLKSHESSKAMLAKELNSLQVTYRDISREKQRLQDILEETKRSLQQKSDRMISLDKELKEHKHQLKEKTRYIQEVVSERDSLQEKLTYQQTQTELLTENLDTAKSENRKQLKDIETLKSQMNNLSERRGSLSEELKKLNEEHQIRIEKDQTKLEALQHEKDLLIAEIKAAQNIIRKQLTLMGLYDAVDGQEDDEKKIRNSVESILQKLSKTEKECRESKAETRKLKMDMDEMSRVMSDENVSLANELQKMKDDVYQELQKEKNRYDEEMKQARGRIESQKDKIQKLTNNLAESENKTTQFQQLIDERESQLRMITSEKAKLVDSVEFLQQEIQKADANLLEKEKELQSIKMEKEVQVSSLTTKQEQILNELREANEKLAEKENDQFMKAAQVDQIVDSLRKENEEMKAAKLQIEVELSQLENELKKKEDEKKTITKNNKEEIKSLNQQVAGLEEKIAEQEYLIEKSNRELEKKARENSNLNKKVKQLIEESELVGDQGCQVAQVQQVESAAMSFEAFEAEEKVGAFAKEKEEIKQKYEETMKELERQRKISQAKIQLFQQKEKDCQKLKQEIEYERREKIEALNCLKAMIVDNEAMATCVNGLQETVALQRQENTDTRRHLQEVLEKYEMQREVSMRTQKTFEDLIESKMSYDHQENRRLKQDFEHIKREKEKMTFQIEQKDKELERVTTEVDELKGLVETKIVNFEVEKRARELLESKFHQFSTDSSFAQRRLLSMEGSQKDLHDKLVDLQKWHNSLEVTLLHGSPQSPLPINDLYEDQKRREKFLNDQVSALTEKYKKLGDDRQIKENKNVFSEER